MYLGVDIGGTKTLVAALDEHGTITEKIKFLTPKSYDNFLLELRHSLSQLATKDFTAGAVAIPAVVIDRIHGRAISFGNLPWQNVSIQRDVEDICQCPIIIENDAKLAGLSEAMLLQKDYQKVLYVTISTGIGYGLVVDGVIDTTIGDGGGRTILLDHKGKMTPWEDFAGGRAIVKRYGKKAQDINDKATWEHICRDLAQGFIQLIAVMQPEVIVIGGSVGSYFERYGELLAAEIESYKIPLITLPLLRQAQRPEEAVFIRLLRLSKTEVWPWKN